MTPNDANFWMMAALAANNQSINNNNNSNANPSSQKQSKVKEEPSSTSNTTNMPFFLPNKPNSTPQASTPKLAASASYSTSNLLNGSTASPSSQSQQKPVDLVQSQTAAAVAAQQKHFADALASLIKSGIAPTSSLPGVNGNKQKVKKLSKKERLAESILMQQQQQPSPLSINNLVNNSKSEMGMESVIAAATLAAVATSKDKLKKGKYVKKLKPNMDKKDLNG